MRAITQWSTLICLSSVACVIVELILPSGEMNKILKVILSLFVIVSFLLPFSNGLPKFDLKWKYEKVNENRINNFMDSINKQVENITQSNLKASIETILSDMGIANEKIEIFMDTSQDNCISISKCKLYIPKNPGSNLILRSSDLLKIKRELEKRIHIDTEVYIQD